MFIKKSLKSILANVGITGDGKLENALSLEDYRRATGADIKITGSIKSNEYGSQDWTHDLIDENCDDFSITVEVKDGFITHSYF